MTDLSKVQAPASAPVPDHRSGSLWPDGALWVMLAAASGAIGNATSAILRDVWKSVFRGRSADFNADEILVALAFRAIVTRCRQLDVPPPSGRMRTQVCDAGGTWECTFTSGEFTAVVRLRRVDGSGADFRVWLHAPTDAPANHELGAIPGLIAPSPDARRRRLGLGDPELKDPGPRLFD
ncbi:hypothetical protein [Actinokineospora sp. HUAS TT18]|uniref:hypothetical protein n=1 Tax=Actinokineospora sp. HUAS TT18 TaxID=3447451 RepID=UPI003F51BCB5